ncbi:MAG: hypothetical protein UGF89_00175 [Acutalibacteraceae bacterium]|nr:hypothetical protein [Acutalibacteraceae bacterium]
MDNNEINNVFAIPVNYTDSGKFANGMFETRNAIEAVILVLLFGYPLVAWVPVSLTAKVVIATIFILPIAILALIGIDGDSFSQYVLRVFKYSKSKRKLHLRRVGYKYNEADLKFVPRKEEEQS